MSAASKPGSGTSPLAYFLLSVVMCFMLLSTAIAGAVKYPVSAIPSNLLKNADMVVRIDETILEISSMSKATEKVHLVYTVLRECAQGKATLRVFYDNDSRISSIGGKIYNAAGMLTRDIKSSDIIDESAVPYGTLYSDDRVKFTLPVSAAYPYTVEFEYERVSKQLVQYPTWHLVDDFNTSIEYARLQVIPGNGTPPRYLSLNFPPEGSWPEKHNDSTMTWEMKNIPAYVDEPLNPGIVQISPLVYLAPAKILIQGEDPLPATWNAYGKWINSLNHDRGTLPEEIAGKILQLTNGTTDTVSKLRIIYRYFQENTRYISVQIGIGGFQPATAFSVARNGYGDCKALANYLKSLLACAGLTSHYTLVKAGDHAMPVRTDFPGQQFNHAILCVPLEHDTIWLESTSQTIPFGFLGSFTDNRDVLVVTADGGLLARTPAYPASYNRLNRTVQIDLDSMGNAHLSATATMTGLQYEEIDKHLHDTPDEQKKSLLREIMFPAVNIRQLRYHEDPGKIPSITETMELDIPAYATFSGNMVFIPLNIFNRFHPLPAPDESRNSPFDPGIPFVDSDSIVVRLPASFIAGNLPEPAIFNSTFGKYSATAVIHNREIVYLRHFKREGREFPAKDYAGYHSFIRQIAKADKSKAVMQK